MNCPTCGAPNVILHKDIWECGWCGDSGPIPRRIQTAIEQGKTELAEHLYALLQSNPLPREEWREDPDAFKSLMEKPADTEDNAPMYRY